jgi:hypothetical protein
MLNVIEQEHGVIGKNILEIGAGPFPRLAELISIKQNGNGSITAYDPSLVTDYLHDVRLVKEKFTNTALLNNYDLVILHRVAYSLGKRFYSSEDKEDRKFFKDMFENQENLLLSQFDYRWYHTINDWFPSYDCN